MITHHRTTRRRRVLGAAAAALAVVLAFGTACSSGDSDIDADGHGTLKVRGDVYFTGAVLPLIAGIEEGIFSKHGLDIQMNEGTGSATTIQTVANGSDDIGYADAGTMVQAIGRGMKVQMVAGMVQKSPLAIFTLPGNGITRPEDLNGKTGSYTPGSAAERLFPAYAEAAGIDEGSVKFRNVDVPTRTQLLLNGDVDFTFGLINTTGPNMRIQFGKNPTILPYTDAGVQTLSSGIVVSDKFADEHPEAVKNYLAALSEAVDYTNKNLDKAVNQFLAHAKTSKLSAEQVAEQWKASMALAFTQSTEGQPFGCTSTEDWTSTIDLMQKYGDVKDGAVSVADAASNAFLPAKCADDLSKDE